MPSVSDGERFKDYVARIGKKALKEMVDAFSAVPAYAVDRSFYSDWRDPREFTISDITTGECAGEVVPQIEFDLQAAEQRNFEAQIHLEQGELQKADEAAYQSMLIAAKGLVRTQMWDVPDDPDRIVAEFKRRASTTRSCSSRRMPASTPVASLPCICSIAMRTRTRCSRPTGSATWWRKRSCSSRRPTAATSA